VQKTLTPFAPLKSLQGRLVTDLGTGLTDAQTSKLERAGLLSVTGLHEAILVAPSSVEEFLGIS
jgi:hypothetical protein